MNLYVIGENPGTQQWISMGHDEEEALMNHAIRIHGEFDARFYLSHYIVHTSLGTEQDVLSITLKHYMG